MTPEQSSTESEASEALRAAAREYEIGTSILDALETAIESFEKHLARVEQLQVDDMRRIPDHCIRTRELTLRLQQNIKRLDEQVGTKRKQSVAHGSRNPN